MSYIIYFTDKRLVYLRLSVLLLLTLFLCCRAKAQKVFSDDRDLIEKVFKYKDTHLSSQKDTIGSVYIKFVLITARRNPTLMCIPTMFAVSRGNRCYIGESYNSVAYKEGEFKELKRIAEVGTIPYNRETMPTMVEFVTPNIYDITIYNEHTISPLHYKNRLYYKYDVRHTSKNKARIEFTPKVDNTQLVKGWADVDVSTGRVSEMEIDGQYDMSKYNISIVMGDEDDYPLRPKHCKSKVTFQFLGNEIYTQYYADFNIGPNKTIIPKNRNEREQMALLRTVPLTDMESDIYTDYDAMQERSSTTKKEKSCETKLHKKIWNSIGDNLLSRHKVKFGNGEQGMFRLSPILNPLYLGYSGRKGLTYKFNLRMSYIFSQKYDVNLQFKGGYSFKQHQFYFRVPIFFNYNKEHNAYVKFELGNGNRIVNSEILDAITSSDSLKDIARSMEHFRDFNVTLVNHYDFNKYLGFEAGFVMHRRSAVDSKAFEISGKPTSYYSFAPTFELQYRPMGYDGLIFTVNYERNIKGVGKTNTEYERIEGDMSYKYNFHKLRKMSFRLGGGIYTTRSKNAYFLDFVNFREENIVGGWDDDWACEFQLLNSAYYNASRYYARINYVYESPIMVMSRIPFVGRYIENERIYNNILFVNNLHMYVENGYGFTTRIFSMGMFVATENGRYHGFGCRFGFELFSKW